MFVAETLKPLRDVVVVLVDAPKTETSSGIVIPETSRQKAFTGKVLGVGREVVEDVKVGDSVAFDVDGVIPTPMEEDGRHVVLVEESDILYTFKEQ